MTSPIPDLPRPYLERYLTMFRPMIWGTARHDALWASAKEDALTGEGIHERVCRHTGEAFGHAVHPHQAKLDGFEDRKASLEAELSGVIEPTLRVHPNLGELYRRKVAAPQDALVDRATRDEALQILHGLVERVSVTPCDEGIAIELAGDLAGILALTNESPRRTGRGL